MATKEHRKSREKKKLKGVFGAARTARKVRRLKMFVMMMGGDPTTINETSVKKKKTW